MAWGEPARLGRQSPGTFWIENRRQVRARRWLERNKTAAIQRASDGGRWFPEVAPRGPLPSSATRAGILGEPSLQLYGPLSDDREPKKGPRRGGMSLTGRSDLPPGEWAKTSNHPRLAYPAMLTACLPGRCARLSPLKLARALEKRPDTQRVDAGPPFPGPASVTTG